MPTRYNKFVHEENVRRFEKRLETETDLGQRTLLRELLAEEWKQLRHPLEAPDDEAGKPGQTE
ncbi:hypothetical protein [Mesorhizobium erdmanii]|uniref:Uncharacterized protein n=1 Tax=Mesorhizobium erdmanii TaxID=1777866 RepID=A0A6M7UIJ3_9HYPH|nr:MULTISPECIES: hypothetical protein [Mesorhizobium]OBQ57818.1 hypothetical protein A8146_22420 [Mesorhizobium loti]QKC75587.1 hypothetical protein EB233_08575 [Mesorhizobium erdmanii]